jgi:uncharacterized membrane protein YbhN (UPF0104 family)/tRNA A-37 threonylcarbamoyl transferase component Bud32
MSRTAPSPDEGIDASAGLLAVVAPQRWAPSFFGVVTKGSVRRRPSDAVHLGLACLLIGACTVVTDGFAKSPDGFYQWLVDLPAWLSTVGIWLFVSCTLGAVAVVLLALLATRNFRLALTLLAVGLLTVVVAEVLAAMVDVDAVREAAGDPGSLSAGAVAWLAVSTAVLLTSAPYLVRPARRTVHTVQVLGLLAAALAAIGPIGSLLGAVGLGWAISSLVSLVLGTPKATPTLHAVVDALDDLGISIDHLELAERQTWGETRFRGRAPGGEPATVIVIGRDGTDARFLHKVWRSILYRDAGPSIAVTRSAQLEHRAYMLLMAAKAGVPVSEVVIATSGGREDLALLVLLDPDGPALSSLEPEAITDDALADAWATLAHLHDARLCHGRLGPENLVVGADGTIALLDFSNGSAGAPPERRIRDRVDLLASTAALVGNERALQVAVGSLGEDGVADLLPVLETAALSPAARRALPEPKKGLKQLREDAAALTDREVPKLTELRRVSPGSVVMAAATFLGFYLIVAQFAGVDILSMLETAEWSWVLVAFLVSFVPQLSGSVSLMGAVNSPLPFGPVLAEQFANNFAGLIGGTMATTALVIRFFQKQGLTVAVAASSGVMNALAGGIVQIVLVTVGLLVTTTQFVPSSVGGGNAGKIIVIVIVGVGIAVTVALLVPKLRGALRSAVGPQVQVARENLRTILTSPRKTAMIFGGNLCSQVAFALVIDAALHAYGQSLPLIDIIVINSLASLVGGMAPVPGGMGVIEAGLIAGLTAAGIPQAEAVAATFTARLFTAYLPPIWGWVALGWLRRRDLV